MNKSVTHPGPQPILRLGLVGPGSSARALRGTAGTLPTVRKEGCTRHRRDSAKAALIRAVTAAYLGNGRRCREFLNLCLGCLFLKKFEREGGTVGRRHAMPHRPVSASLRYQAAHASGRSRSL